MTPRDFAYWLQGYFELSQSEDIIANWSSVETQNCVKKHLRLVQETLKANPGYDEKMIRFIGWMESAIEFEAHPHSVKSKLGEIFEHVIDPATPGNQQAMNQIRSSGWGERGARC